MARPLDDGDRDRIRARLPALWGNADVTVTAIAERFGTSTTVIRRIAAEDGLGEKRKVRVARQRELPRTRPGWHA